MNWGMKEHSAEGISSFLLFLDSRASVAYWKWRLDWLVWVIISLTLITFIIHLWARFAHRMEKRAYR